MAVPAASSPGATRTAAPGAAARPAWAAQAALTDRQWWQHGPAGGRPGPRGLPSSTTTLTAVAWGRGTTAQQPQPPAPQEAHPAAPRASSAGAGAAAVSHEWAAARGAARATASKSAPVAAVAAAREPAAAAVYTVPGGSLGHHQGGPQCLGLWCQHGGAAIQCQGGHAATGAVAVQQDSSSGLGARVGDEATPLARQEWGGGPRHGSAGAGGLAEADVRGDGLRWGPPSRHSRHGGPLPRLLDGPVAAEAAATPAGGSGGGGRDPAEAAAATAASQPTVTQRPDGPTHRTG